MGNSWPGACRSGVEGSSMVAVSSVVLFAGLASCPLSSLLPVRGPLRGALFRPLVPSFLPSSPTSPSSVLWRSWGFPPSFLFSAILPEAERLGLGLYWAGGACWPCSPSTCFTLSMALSSPHTLPSRSVQYFTYLSINSLCTCRYSPLEPLLRYFLGSGFSSAF